MRLSIGISCTALPAAMTKIPNGRPLGFAISDDHVIMLCGEIKVKVDGRTVVMFVTCLRRALGLLLFLWCLISSAQEKHGSRSRDLALSGQRRCRV
jgi:hypothetical protein